jgi:hypothetical protein
MPIDDLINAMKDAKTAVREVRISNSLISLRDASRKVLESLVNRTLPDQADVRKLEEAIRDSEEVIPPLSLDTTL